MTVETPEERLQSVSRDRTAKPLPKRFYKLVTVSAEHAILLDGRSVKTPMKNPLRLPNPRLAVAVAAEWDAQAEVINPGLMPLTRLANSAIDGIPPARAAVIADLASYAGSDLTCYRADGPAELVARQKAQWDPVLAWAEQRLGAAFRAHSGISHVPQATEALAAVARHAEGFDDFTLAAAHSLATLTGSALLGLMLIDGAVAPEHGWAAAHVDEDWQIEHWGEDDEARNARAAREGDYKAALNLVGRIP